MPEGIPNPYARKRLEDQGEKVWFSGKNFAKKMEMMKEGLEDGDDEGRPGRVS